MFITKKIALKFAKIIDSSTSWILESHSMVV